MKTQKKVLVIFALLIFLMLSSCSQGLILNQNITSSPINTNTAIPISTSTSTLTLTPTTTVTPSYTATPKATSTLDPSIVPMSILDDVRGQFEKLGASFEKYKFEYKDNVMVGMGTEQTVIYKDGHKIAVKDVKHMEVYKDGVLVGTDSEGNEIYKDGFTLHFAVENLQKNIGLLPIKYKPKIYKNIQYSETSEILNKYAFPLTDRIIEEFNNQNNNSSNTLALPTDHEKLDLLSFLCLNPDTNSWGVILVTNGFTYLGFEQIDGKLNWVPLAVTNGKEIVMYYRQYPHNKE